MTNTANTVGYTTRITQSIFPGFVLIFTKILLSREKTRARNDLDATESRDSDESWVSAVTLGRAWYLFPGAVPLAALSS